VASKNLECYVLTMNRTLSPDNFKKWMNSLLKTHIWNLINSTSQQDKLGGLAAIDGLLEIISNENLSILTNYLHMGLKSGDVAVMTYSAKVLGHLALGDNSITTECVEGEIQNALTWLQNERNETQRHSACLVFHQLAVNAPTLFYSNVSNFIDVIWTALKDTKESIREAAGLALGACLKIISERDSKYRLQWYQKIFDEAQKGFGKNATAEILHGTLIAIGELLLYTQEFLKPKYIDLVKTILKYKENKNKIIQKSLIKLIPTIAAFNSTAFVQNFLEESVNFLLNCLKKDIERKSCFISIGNLAVQIGIHFEKNIWKRQLQ